MNSELAALIRRNEELREAVRRAREQLAAAFEGATSQPAK